MTPEKAASERAGPQQAARALVEGGDPVQAGVNLDIAAAEHGDPVLYLDAGDAYLAGARAERDEELARAAIERGHIALDILYFHIDEAADPRFRMVEGADVPDLIARGKTLIEDAETLIFEIEQERLEPIPDAEPEPEKKKREVNTAMVLTITGASLTVLGVAALGIGAAGIGLGFARQQEAEDPAVYGEDYDAVEVKGKRANLMAYVGLPVGAVLLGGGIAALVIANKKRKQGPREPTDEDDGTDGADVAVAPWVMPGRTGLSLRGRF